MDYCATQKLLQNSAGSRNVFHTLFYCHQIDSYLEQHRILEIVGELMMSVCIDRPADVAEYLCRKLMEMSARNVEDVVEFEFHNSMRDGSKMMKTLSAQHRLPLIECVSGLNPDEFRKRLDKFLRRCGLHSHRLIICDFKDTETREKILRISRDETSRTCSAKPQDVVDIQLPSDGLNQQQMNYVYASIRQWTPRRIIKENWKLRVLIVGREGSGRRTQGALMAQEFRLKLIDLRRLETQHQQQQTMSVKHRLSFWGHLQETVLKPDCLSSGYVLVCHVISMSDLKVLMEKFICHPNRIIFMHTSETECRRRCSTMENYPAGDENILGYQMKLYELHKRAFVEYVAGIGHKIFHVNGNKSVCKVKSTIWANLGC